MPVTTYQHGRGTAVKMRVTGGGAFTDISQYVSSSTLPFNREEHETTTYDPTLTEKTFQGGNVDRTFSMSGNWSTAVDAILAPFVAAASVDIQWGKLGAGTGAAYKQVTGFVTKYEDPTDAGDIDKWSMDIRVSGAVTSGTF